MKRKGQNDSVAITTKAQSLRSEIESLLIEGEWIKFWRQVQREVARENAILADPKHLLQAFAKIQKRRLRSRIRELEQEADAYHP